MKKLFYSIILLMLSATVFAQAPQSFKYQAVARDASGEIIADQAVSFQISILQGSETGTPVYTETHADSTNQFGLITLEIGTGTTTDDFSGIDWSNDAYFIKVEMDASGGTSYTLMGTSQLLSVPYALHARIVENVNVPIYTTTEIIALTPEEGNVVYNNTESLYQIYNGISWVSLPASCWPQPTIANAGDDQYYTDTTTTATLSANTPEPIHGTGIWSIISGEGGSFVDTNNPNTSFNGQLHTEYTLRWTISTTCDTSYDYVIISFLQNGPGEILNDVDGNTYKTIWIGKQVWMAENLKSIHFADGTPLVSGTGVGDISGDYTTKYYFWYNDDSATYSETYGALYTWAAAMNGEASSDENPSGVQGVCPDNWHVPSDAEWKQLEMYLGMSQAETDETGYRGTDEGGKLKETGITHWESPNVGATNEYGFTALPGGQRNGIGNFGYIGNYGFWLSSTKYNTNWTCYREMGYSHSDVERSGTDKWAGYSVRCIKDE